MAENINYEPTIVFRADASQLESTFDQIVNEITKVKEELKQYRNDKEKSAELTKKLNDLEMQLVDTMKQENNVLKTSNVSYRQLNDILKDLNKSYKDAANASQRLNIAPAAKAINQELKTMDASIGQYNRNVGNYADDINKAFQGIQLQTQQLVRELPSMKYGFEMFFLAISNNLPMFADAIKRYNELNKARKASTVNASADAAAHKQEAVGTAESTAAHEAEAGAVGLSSAAHLKEVEALKADALAQKESAIQVRKTAEEKLAQLKIQKQDVETKMQQMQFNRQMAASDREAMLQNEAFLELKRQNLTLDGQIKSQEIALADARVDEATATRAAANAEKELNKVRKESEAAASPLKAFGKALFSWQTLLMLAIVALTLYSKEIGHFIATLFAGNKEFERFQKATALAGVELEDFAQNAADSNRAVDQLNKSMLKAGSNYNNAAKSSNLFLKEQRELNKAMMEGAKSMAQQYVEIRLLQSIMNEAELNIRSYVQSEEEYTEAHNEWNQAAEKMLEKLGETVDETNVAAMKTGEYSEKIDQLVHNLYRQAEAQGAIQLLQKFYTETILKAQGKLIDAELNEQNNKFKNFWQGVEHIMLNTWLRISHGGQMSKEDFLDRKVEKWRKNLAEAKTTFEAYLTEITKMFNFDELFGGDNGGGGGSKADDWFSRWEMKIKELEADMGMLAEKNGDINLADTWKYSAEGLDYYTKKFDEYAAHYRKVNKGLKDEDNKDLRELEVQRTKYLEDYYKYQQKLAKQYTSALETEKETETRKLIEWYSEQVALYQQAGLEITDLDAEYEKRMEAILDKYQTKYKHMLLERWALNRAEASDETGYREAQMNLELAKLKDTMDKEIKEYERKGISTVELEEHYAQERAKIVSKYAKKEAEARIDAIKDWEKEQIKANEIAKGKKDLGNNPALELKYASVGGTTITGHYTRMNEMALATDNYNTAKDSAEQQIQAMKDVLESGKLIGQEKLDMESQLAKAEMDLADLTAEYEIERDRMVLEDRKASFQEMMGYIQQGAQGIGQAFDDVYTAIEKTMEMRVKEGKITNEQAEKQLEQYRGIKAAAAAMDALGSAVGAYNSLASIPYVGPALGALAAAAALAAGYANVRLIMATTKDNAAGNLSQAVPQASDFNPNYSVNLTGKEDTEYLRNAMDERPIRAYVVESDISAAQELQNRRNEESSF